ncbi:MAG: hypothetical protein M3Y69_10175 [Verrucomicrobiota bacterium]|nr:hypothetical protein [Verrucomicrobiota bacterium]
MNIKSSPSFSSSSSARHAFRVFFAAAAFMATATAPAATPATGSLNPSSTNTITWKGDATGTGAAQGESTCVDGLNCDVFTITLSGTASDYSGKQLAIAINWTVPANDYDLYVHKDSLAGALVASSANGAPQTSEQVSINPATSGVGKYVVHVVYFATTPVDQYTGTAKITAAATVATRTATYLTDGLAFSPNVPVKAPVTARDGEPSSRTDFMGNCYVGGIRGVPAGVDLWYFNLNAAKGNYDPFMRVPNYRGQPDALSPSSGQFDAGGDGGGDIDLAVGFQLPANQADPTLAFSSLAAANISTGNSLDRAQTYNKNPAGNVTGGAAGDDREWEEFLGSTSVYLFYRTLEPAVTMIQRSDDGGLTFGAAKTAGTSTQVGPIDVHQTTGTVVGGTSQGTVVVGVPSTPKAEPLTYNVYQAATDPNGVAHLFFVTKIADDGTLKGTIYVCYSNDRDVFLKHSTDEGKTWSPAVRVNDGATTKVNIFPWMETGPTPGSVGVVWYGTTSGANTDAAEWKVYFAQSFDASSATPTFRIAEVTEPEHVIHASNISEGGLTGAANRNLIDYFQVSFDPQGAAVVAYTDDHNDFDGHTYVAHQIGGPSIRGGMLPPPAEGSALFLPPGTSSVSAADAFPPRVPGFNGEQVTDFPFDVQDGLLARVRVADPFDITSIRYDTSGTGAKLAIAATMRVSDLSTIPPGGTWQINFAVNAPHSVLSATGTYTYGASDHADQFYVQADTDASGAQTFTYGTATRLSTGALSYTQVGTADAGEFDSATNTISVQVSVEKLNAAIPKGHTLISNGAVVTGLRGRSITASNPGTTRAHNDLALGGTQFTVHDSTQPAPAAVPVPTPMPVAAPVPGTTPAATPARTELANIATRLQVLTGDQQGVAGIIVRGAALKRVMIRGIGPSLSSSLGTAAIPDPVLNVFDSAGTNVASNDDWRSRQQAEISATGLAPTSDRESAVILTLQGNTTYTATLTGKGGGTGLGLIEAYDLDAGTLSDFGEIATRGVVSGGDNILIGGFIVRPNDSTAPNQKIVVRAIGPSLAAQNVTGPLQDPTITLYDGNGTLLETNDNFADSAEAGEISANKLAPLDPRESAILRILSPGAYTAVVTGAGGSTGVGLVEVYNLGAP